MGMQPMVLCWLGISTTSEPAKERGQATRIGMKLTMEPSKISIQSEKSGAESQNCLEKASRLWVLQPKTTSGHPF
jgi:hypothetical protein